MKNKLIKKIIAMIVISIIVFSCISCTNSEDNNTITTQKENKDENEESNMKDKYKTYEELPGIIFDRTDAGNYTIASPMKTNRITKTGYIAEDDDYYIICDGYKAGITNKKYKIDANKITSGCDVISSMKDQFLWTATDGLNKADSYTYVIEETEDIEINGLDMCKNIGYFEIHNQSSISKAQFVAYSTIKNKYPIYFIVVDKTSNQNQGDYIADLADKMATTFREYDKTNKTPTKDSDLDIKDYDGEIHNTMYPKFEDELKNDVKKNSKLNAVSEGLIKINKAYSLIPEYAKSKVTLPEKLGFNDGSCVHCYIASYNLDENRIYSCNIDSINFYLNIEDYEGSTYEVSNSCSITLNLGKNKEVIIPDEVKEILEMYEPDIEVKEYQDVIAESFKPNNKANNNLGENIFISTFEKESIGNDNGTCKVTISISIDTRF